MDKVNKLLSTMLVCEHFEETSRKPWYDYMAIKKEWMSTSDEKLLEACMLSEANWLIRSRHDSCLSFGIEVKKGDIAYIDFGQAYLHEAGFQHFGLVMNVWQNKALVIPMTSNKQQYYSAYDPIDNPTGKSHLMRIGKIEGLTKPSVLFLNDSKYINSARIIDVKAHIIPSSPLFKQIMKRLLKQLG